MTAAFCVKPRRLLTGCGIEILTVINEDAPGFAETRCLATRIQSLMQHHNQTKWRRRFDNTWDCGIPAVADFERTSTRPARFSYRPCAALRPSPEAIDRLKVMTTGLTSCSARCSMAPAPRGSGSDCCRQTKSPIAAIADDPCKGQRDSRYATFGLRSGPTHRGVAC